jgi:hypothetical protein
MTYRRTPLRFYLLAAALWLSAAPAFGQQYMELPPHSLVGNMKFQPNPGSVVTLQELVAALSNPPSGLLVRAPASATPGHAVVFGASPNDIVDGGGLAGSGTVTQVVCGPGLSGGTITTNGTCAINLTTATNSLGSNVTISNVAYSDGPSMAQGTSGTWYASGTVTVTDSVAPGQMKCKLWDGTTVIASANIHVTVSNDFFVIPLSGSLASPAANIRISCQTNGAGATASFQFNASGNSKDATVSGVRIQ